MRWLDGITISMEFKQAPGAVKDREVWRAAGHGVEKSWTRLSDWKTTRSYLNAFNCTVFIYILNCTFMGLSNLPSFLNIFTILAFFFFKKYSPFINFYSYFLSLIFNPNYNTCICVLLI